MFPVRLAVVAGLLATLAVATPKFMPALLADLTATAPAAPDATAVAAPAPGIRQAVVRADRDGHYLVEALVEGRTIAAMIDTGATTVALTAATARRLGIVPARSDYSVSVSTANGVVAAAPVALREVRLGAVTVRDVKAVVIPDDALSVNLLGMTFLARLARFESGGGEMLLVE